MKHATFKTNINCGSCVKAVTPRLQKVEGILHWEVDTARPDKVLSVDMAEDVTPEILDAVRKSGFDIQQIA
ncbi:MAG: heavy-metal-associated domain-containing protein [Chitinophagaceae bacterium]